MELVASSTIAVVMFSTTTNGASIGADIVGDVLRHSALRFRTRPAQVLHGTSWEQQETLDCHTVFPVAGTATLEARSPGEELGPCFGVEVIHNYPWSSIYAAMHGERRRKNIENSERRF